jgi:hypothetical protein
MNSYTAEELNCLIKELIPSDERRSTNIITITFGRNSSMFDEKLFFATVFLDPVLNPKDFIHSLYNKKDRELLLDIRKFIYEVPLHQVPLYINVYDVLVEWRLKIGK